MEITAKLNNLRISPRKVRLVAKAIRGMDATVAKHQLDYIIKKSSKPISRLLDSALFNAQNNFGLVKENLFVKDVVVNEGPKLKRFRPKGFGMASPIEKKTSRIRIVLEERVPGLKADKTKVEKHKTKEEVSEEPRVVAEEKAIMKQQTPKPEVKKEIGKKGGVLGRVSGLGRKFFRRKAI